MIAEGAPAPVSLHALWGTQMADAFKWDELEGEAKVDGIAEDHRALFRVQQISELAELCFLAAAHDMDMYRVIGSPP